MKKLQTLLLALCAAIFAACSSDSIVDEPTPTPQPEPQGITTIHATIEPMTRTAIGEEAADHSAKITWQQGDRILAFGEGGAGKAIYEIANADDAATGKFTLVSGQTALTAITAANYPATGEAKGDFNLSVQVYNPAADAFPAYMTADAPAADQLTFKHAVAYICVNLKADRLDEILLRGTGIVTCSADEDEWITLLCNQTAPFTTTARQFFIAMQPKETIDLNIIVNKGQYAAKKVVTAKTFEKKHVYRASADYPAADIPTGWQPLRDRFGQTSFEGIVINGLAWAPVNLGYAIDPAHLDWGEQDKRRGRFYSSTDISDIPEGWRKPTNDECSALCNGITDPRDIMVTSHNYARPIGWYLDGTGVPGKKGVHFDAPTPGHSAITNECRLWTDKTGAFWTATDNTIFVLETGNSTHSTTNDFKFWNKLDGAWRFAIRCVKVAGVISKDLLPIWDLKKQIPWPCKYKLLDSNEDITTGADATWAALDFDDTGWTDGQGQFNNYGSFATYWDSSKNAILIRRHFTMTEELMDKLDKATITVTCSYDEYPILYLNGEQICSWNEFSDARYDDYVLTAEQKALLREGDNVLAVSLRKGVGGGHIDYGLKFEATVYKPL